MSSNRSSGENETEDDAENGTRNENGSREITVPLRTYKAITVFSTLLAIVLVVLGFGFLDAATAGTGPLAVVLRLFDLRGVAGSALSVVLALVGLGFIGLGAGTYVLGTRFRTEGMGKGKDDGDELPVDE